MTTCIYCGKKLKWWKNHCECYGCRCARRLIEKENPPKTKERKAIKHLNQKGAGLLNQIYNS